MAQIHIDRLFSAEIDKIWHFMADFEAASSPKINVKILKPGDNSNHSAGLIREVKIENITVREKILRVVPMESIDYQLLSGAPVHDYFGIITFLPERKGTTVRWIVTFKPKFPWPEWMIKRKIISMIGQVLDELEKISGDQ